MRAILFDVNGTLLDTREHIFWQFEELTRHFDGAAASRQEIAEAMQGTTDDVIRRLVKNQDAHFDDIKAHHNKLHTHSFDRLVLYPGVTDLLPILRRVGFRVAAVASGDDRIAQALEYTGIRPYFDLIVTDAHVAEAKPHPASVSYALKHMGIDPASAIVVGDSPADILAGKRAGVSKTIAVLHGFGDHDTLREAAPDHYIEDIPSLLDVVE